MPGTGNMVVGPRALADLDGYPTVRAEVYCRYKYFWSRLWVTTNSGAMFSFREKAIYDTSVKRAGPILPSQMDTAFVL